MPVVRPKLRKTARSDDVSHAIARDRVIENWLDVLSRFPESDVHKQLLAMDDEAARLACVRDVLAPKATATLQLRLGSLRQFERWYRTVYGVEVEYMVLEDVVYEYMVSLRAAKAPRTRARTFVDTLSFVAGVFSSEGWRASARITGASGIHS
eukprot:6459729-Amphidinium_carterae.1